MTKYPKTIRKYLSISGFEGCGKSEACRHISQQLGFFLIPEIARTMFPVNELVLKKQLDELSEQTFCGYITGHHVCIANHIQQTIQDRCILDPLTYQALYSPDKQFNISGVQQLIDQFNDTHDQSSLLDVAVLIKHPTNTQFIQETVFADSDRKYSTDVAQYLNDAALFERTFIELYERLDGLASDLVIVEPFTSNSDILKDITLLAAGL